MSTPKPGIYHDVPFEEYLEWDALSASRIKLAISRSLAHFRLGFVGEETPAMRFGSLTHCGRLEPLAVAERYAVMPDYASDAENVRDDGSRSYSAGTKYVKEKRRLFAEANRGKTIVSQADYDHMKGIVTALASNERACHALSGSFEVSCVWEDPETGQLCKCRHDAISFERQTIGDLKTTKDCVWFWRDVSKLLYHVQMAHYQNSIRVLRGETYTPWLVPVEKTSPYGNMAAPVSAGALRAGRRKLSEAMRLIKEATENNHWPGYASPDEWDVPDANEPVEVTIGGTKVTI